MPTSIQLVSSSPSQEDNLSHQSHTKLANAIRHLMMSGGGKFIGLSGRWGSGKSTVIEIINSAKTDDLYLHDIWSKNKANHYHALMSGIARHKRYGSEELLKINSLSHKSTNTTRFSPTSIEMVFIILIISLPFSIQFFNAALGISSSDIAINRGMYAFGWVISIFSFFCLSLIIVRMLLSARAHNKNGENTQRNGRTYDSGVGVLWGSATKNSVVNEIQVEEDWGERLFSFLSSVCESGRLNICVDNIERLSESDQTRAWEFMSYLKSCQHRLISAGKELNVVSTFSMDTISDQGRDHIDKLFDVVYRIPDFPGMVGEEFAHSIISESFPANNVKELVSIVFYQWGVSSPSPREIVSSVNQAISLYNLHDGDISDFSCFVFSAYLKEINLSLGSLGSISDSLPRFIVSSKNYNENEILSLALCSGENSIIRYKEHEILLNNISMRPEKWMEGGADNDSIYILATQNFISRLKDMKNKHYGVSFVLSGIFSDEVLYFRHVPVHPHNLITHISSISNSSIHIHHNQDRVYSLFKEWWTSDRDGLFNFIRAIYNDYIISTSETEASYSLYKSIKNALDMLLNNTGHENNGFRKSIGLFRSTRNTPELLTIASWMGDPQEVRYWDKESLYLIIKNYISKPIHEIPLGKLEVIYQIISSSISSGYEIFELVDIDSENKSMQRIFPLLSIIYFSDAVNGNSPLFNAYSNKFYNEIVDGRLIHFSSNDLAFFQLIIAGALIKNDRRLTKAIKLHIPSRSLKKINLNDPSIRNLIDKFGAAKLSDNRDNFLTEIERLYQGGDI